MGKQTRESSKQPVLTLCTDDDMSASSELKIEIVKSLGRLRVTHKKQSGSRDSFFLFPHQIEELNEFIKQGGIWIESGYKDKLKPVSKTEDYGGNFT